jgi:hypothetical protein
MWRKMKTPNNQITILDISKTGYNTLYYYLSSIVHHCKNLKNYGSVLDVWNNYQQDK